MPLTLQARGKKKTIWIIGTLCGERVRESTRTTDRRIAEAKLIRRTKEIEQRAIHGAAASFTFAEAVELYVRRSKPSAKEAWVIGKLLDYWGDWRCHDITPAAMMAYEKIRHPKAVKNSTLRRSIYGPMNAILRMAAENGLCGPVVFPKPKMEKVRVKAAPDDYMAQLLACEMEPWLRAAVLIMTYHGTRPSDLKRLRWADISFSNNVITFGKTKNGMAHAPVMHPEVREALLAYFSKLSPWPGKDAPVFGKLQGSEPATTLNQYLRGLCKRNALPFYSTHKIGRHAFACRILNAGHTLKDAQQAGNWQSISVVADLYGHLERSRVDGIVTGMRIVTNEGQTCEPVLEHEQDQAVTK